MASIALMIRGKVGSSKPSLAVPNLPEPPPSPYIKNVITKINKD